MDNEPMLLCPVCRIAVPDRIFFVHSAECQKKKAKD